MVLLPPVWPLSISLAATLEIDVSFSSSAYLDVSVQRVSLRMAMYSPYDDCAWPQPGFPIRKSAGITDICSLPQLIAAYHVLLRHLMPRHSPYALISLTFSFLKLCSSPNRIIWVYAFAFSNLIQRKLLPLTFNLKDLTFLIIAFARYRLYNLILY